MKQTFGQKFTEQAAASYKSELEPAMREFATTMAAQIMGAFEVSSKHMGAAEIFCTIDGPGEFPMAFQFRNELVEALLDNLPVDIGCKIMAEDWIAEKFVIWVVVVEAYKGGRKQYDFPFWVRKAANSEKHNLDHLKTLELEGDELLAVDAFEIILSSGIPNMIAKESALDWGMANPQAILDLTDPSGFFKQFTDFKSEIETAPYTGGV